MITIVSGLPRSGTSLMMQMLVAGGLVPLSDGERAADVDNPKGYLEWERIKTLPQDPGCIAEAEGKLVKVISKLVLSLPSNHEYRIIFMQRPLNEVMASQEQMLRRRGVKDPGGNAAAIAKAFQNHLSEVDRWFAKNPNAGVLRVPYHDVLSDARRVASELAEFLKAPLNVDAMVKQVDGSLYRNRS